MPEKTNDELRHEIAEKLREIATRAELDTFVLAPIKAMLCCLADELQQPKPEFEPGAWVVTDCGEIAQVDGPAPTGADLVRLRTMRGYPGVWIDRPWTQFRRFDGDLPSILQQYIDGKLISTDGLPELPEGQEYFVISTEDAKQSNCHYARTAAGGSVDIMVRQKDTTEQPSPTGET